MPSRGEIYSALHDTGMSYDAIGKIYGISKQAVSQAIARFKKTPCLTPYTESLVNRIKYKGLSKWMLNNCVSISELEKRCGATKLYPSLIGKFEPSKKNIDRILEITGLTYEECFKE